MALVKSKLLENLSDNYPNFLKKDLTKLVEIIISQIQEALIRNERVELRDIFTLEPKIQKARISRNPRTNEKVIVPEKKTVQFKMSKKWFININNESIVTITGKVSKRSNETINKKLLTGEIIL